MRGFKTISPLVSEFIESETIFVFGSNLSGVHGAGAANYAWKWRQAERGVGVGMTGQCYALPTKGEYIPKSKLAEFEPISWERICEEADRFLAYAMANPELTFQLTRVGCGLAHYTDQEMALLFQRALKNVLLPGVWRVLLTPSSYRALVVAGSRTLLDEKQTFPLIDAEVSRLQAAGHKVVIVSGGARGPDTHGERYAEKKGLKCARFIPEWNGPRGKAAGMLRNQTMAWFGSNALCLLDDAAECRGTKAMIKLARESRLEVTVRALATDATWREVK